MKTQLQQTVLVALIGLVSSTPAWSQVAETKVRFGPPGGFASGMTDGDRGDVRSSVGPNFASGGAVSQNDDGSFSWSSGDIVKLPNGQLLGLGHQMHYGKDGTGYGTIQILVTDGEEIELNGRAGPDEILSGARGSGRRVDADAESLTQRFWKSRRFIPIQPRMDCDCPNCEEDFQPHRVRFVRLPFVKLFP